MKALKGYSGIIFALGVALCAMMALPSPSAWACPKCAGHSDPPVAEAPARLADLSRRLQAVPTAAKDSFRQAQSILVEAFSPNDPVGLRELAIDVWLRDYYERALDRSDLLGTLGVTSPLARFEQLPTIRRQTKPLGFDADVEDGEVVLQARPALLNARLGTLAGPAWQAYWCLQAREDGSPLEIDGVAALSPEAMRARLMARERLLTRFPDFVRRAEIEQDVRWILTYYLGAPDPAALLDPHGQLRQDVRASYDRFLRQNADSPSAPLVRGLVDIAQAHEGEDAIRAFTAFLRAHGLPPESPTTPETTSE